MSKKIDLTGKKFGKLTVLKEAPKRGQVRYWLCQCDCGSNPKEIKQGHLTSGATISCGCAKNQKRPKIDLTNQRFGRLVAKAPTDYRKHGHTIWLCQCDCGNTKYVPSTYLTSGDTQSCGCLKKEKEETNLVEKYEDSRVDDVVLPLFKGKEPRKDSTTGYRGVSKYYTRKSKKLKYRAWITVNGKRYYKGGFDTPEEAYYKGRLELERLHLPKEEKQNE